ncbi:MAG: DUF6538 domain-containing protein [Azonexus sp.]
MSHTTYGGYISTAFQTRDDLLFRRRVPDDLKAIAGRPYIVKSLATERRQLAIVLARALASQTDQLFQEWRGMAKSSGPIRTDFSLEYFTDNNGRERVSPS